MNYFFDTSALIKRYMIEGGSVWVDRTLNRNNISSIWVSKITLVEVLSAVSRRVRENTYPSSDVDMFRRLFRKHTQSQYHVIQMTDKVVSIAQDLCLNHPLRAMDSIQLATAIIVNQTIVQTEMEPLIFVCADKKLLSVAQTAGMQPLDVNTMV